LSLPSRQNRQNKNSLKDCGIRNSKYNAILSKTHSYRPLFWRFFPLGKSNSVGQFKWLTT